MDNKRSVWFALAVLFLINTLNFFDRQILSAVGEPVRREFGLGDTELGILNTAFTLIYAFVGLPLGRLADRFSRKKVIAAGVFVWSLFTAVSAAATSFWQIFAFRIGVGVGEASCAPAANSMIGDMFPPEKRARAVSVFMLGLPVGLALSFAVSGYVAQNFGWRSAFLVAGLPGILCVVLALLMREPERESSSVAMPETSAIGDYARLLRNRTLRWIIISGAIHNFSLYAVSAFMTSYMIRFHGLNVQEAGFRSTIIYGVLCLPGLLLGGVIGDLAKKRRRDGAMRVVVVAMILSIPFFFLALGVESGRVWPFVLLVGTSVGFMYFYYSIIYSTIADITPPTMRGSAMAIYFLAMYLLGASFGPYAVGAISDYFSQQAAIAAGVTELSRTAIEPFRAAGLRKAMYVVPILTTLLVAVLYAASRTVAEDMRAAESQPGES